MKVRLLVLCAGAALCPPPILAQQNPVAVVGARIIPITGPEIPNGTMVVQNGKIVAVKDGSATITAMFTSTVKGTSSVSVSAGIDLKFYVSAMTNTSLVPANDTATVRVTVTGQ